MQFAMNAKCNTSDFLTVFSAVGIYKLLPYHYYMQFDGEINILIWSKLLGWSDNLDFSQVNVKSV